MDWLKRPSNSETKLSFSKKSLNIRGVKTSESTKPLKLPRPELNPHPEYTQIEQKKILDFFNLVAATKEYCTEVIEKSRNDFLLFAQNPVYGRFWKRTNMSYDPDWRYDMKILKKDTKLLISGKEILKNIVESTSYTEPEPQIATEHSLEESLKTIKKLLKKTPRLRKLQIKSFFNKFK